MRIRQIFFNLLFAISMSASAIPADPRPVQVTLPDGSQLTLRIFGDENFHYVTTLDGYLVRKDGDGFFKYVDYDPLTRIQKLTPVRAHEIQLRDVEERAYLSKVSTARKLNVSAPQGIERKAHQRVLGRNVTLRPKFLGGAARSTESRYLVILVNFSDCAFQFTSQDFDAWLNEPGYSANGGTGSVKDYYRDNSMGLFVPDFTVVGPVTLDYPQTYYAGNSEDTGEDQNPRAMVREACQKAKAQHPELNFQDFDNDGDGVMDNCYIIYAGYSEASTGDGDDMWPHSWTMSDEAFQIDGITVDEYSCSAELVGASGASMDGIGTFTHEFGHILGLKDMYDTDDYTDGYGIDPGDYSLYASGSYNNLSRTPPCLMAFERHQMGWMTDAELTPMADAEDVTLTALADNKARYINAQPHRAEGTGHEWFVFENRQQTGWDRYIPAHGLLIYHYDYTDEMVEKYWSINGPNNNARHRCLYIVPADNIDDGNTRNGDTWPGRSGNTDFTATTQPAALNWAGEELGVDVNHIREESGNILFQVNGGVQEIPVLHTLAPTVADIRDTSLTVRAEVIHKVQPLRSMGFCWAIGEEPTLESEHLAVEVSDEIACTLTGLLPGASYNVRAYMEQADGSVVYGAAIPVRLECRVAEAPYIADFTSWTDGEPDCWTILDRNGDGTTWIFDKNSESMLYQFDYWNNADDWLISSRMKVPEHGALFFTRGVTEMTCIEKLDVYVSTGSRAVEDFHLVKRFSFADSFGEMVAEEVDLSDFAGQEVYVALVCASDKLQGDLRLWQIFLTGKLETPDIQSFTLEGNNLVGRWNEVPGAVRYLVDFAEVTDEVNNGAVFLPETDCQRVEGQVEVASGNLFFTGDGRVETREYPEGITDCMFYLTSSGPVGTTTLTLEATEDGDNWEVLGPVIRVSTFDNEGTEYLLGDYLKGKTYRRLRITCQYGGRNVRLNYFTLCYNDGTVWNTLAMGGVDGNSVTIQPTTTDEFRQGKKYALTVYAGDGILFYDASAPAFFQYMVDGLPSVSLDTTVQVTRAGEWLHLNGLPAGTIVSIYTYDGRLLRQATSVDGRLSVRLSTSGPVIVKAGSCSWKIG